MYYILYLSSLCRRRRWSDPHYESYQYPNGFTCAVRVNGREYQSESILDTEVLAREAAAMRAYLFCRNFSLNDGAHASSSTMATVRAPQPQTAPVGVSSMAGANRGYAMGNGNGYATGSLPSQSGMPMDNVSGRMVSSQGVIVVGHSQIGM